MRDSGDWFVLDENLWYCAKMRFILKYNLSRVKILTFKMLNLKLCFGAALLFSSQI